MASPLEEEDISRAGVIHEETAPNSPERLSKRRGKQKQRAQDPFNDDGSASSSEEDEAGAESYPPQKENVAESRRIEENLRRWEEVERERRRSARDSASSAATSSLVSDVTRRASLLWSSRRSRHASQGSGAHQVLRNADYSVPLDDIDGPSPAPPAFTDPEPEPETANPFTTPAGSTTSLNDPHHSAVMAESSQLPPFDGTQPETVDADKRPALDRTPSLSRPQPPPKPLDLPSPRTPPPRTVTPHASRPPEPINPPSVSPQEQEVEEPKRRWWTDWICGCSERGDSQAGRTNPFE
ncbi:hypothetical protein EIP86_009092 [Pleurotus ostreatoroseus]|nr:hypothetical protein EIP86_009092 [Pleurotus ostreatoroseus]